MSDNDSGPATRADIQTLRSEIVAFAGNLTQQIDRVETSLNHRIDRVEARIDRVETSLNEKIERVETSLNEKIERIETNLLTAFHQWAQTYEVRARGTSAAVREFDERLCNIEERLNRLERERRQ